MYIKLIAHELLTPDQMHNQNNYSPRYMYYMQLMIDDIILFFFP